LLQAETGILLNSGKMKNLLVILVAVGAGLYFFWPDTRELPPQEFAHALESDSHKLLIDLRSARDFAEGHIAGATNIDFGGPTYEWRIAELDSSLHFFLYCGDGKRSSKAASDLDSRGAVSVRVLHDGLKSWREEDYVLTPKELFPPIILTLKEFSRMMDLEHLVVVDFYRAGDKKCRQIEPALDELSIAYRDKIKLMRIDVDTYKHLATELGIETVPTLHFYENGNLTGWIEGPQGRDRIEGEFALREYMARTSRKKGTWLWL
jgi:rhodanese-related sulfurtransferase